MRIRSTDAVSRSDDSGDEIMDPSSAILDYDAPGRMESFTDASTYSVTGLDSDSNAAQWFTDIGKQWPPSPIVILCENHVFLCNGSEIETQGIEYITRDELISHYTVGVTDRRKHKSRLYRGGYFVLREGDTLWNADYGEDTYTIYRAPGLPDAAIPNVIEGGELCANYPGMSLTILEHAIFGDGEVIVVGGEEAVEVLYRLPDTTAWTRPWQASELTPGMITTDLAHRFLDFKIRPDGFACFLAYKAGEVVFGRSNGPLVPSIAFASGGASTASWTLTSTLLPSFVFDSIAGSQIGTDATTQIVPRIVFDPHGSAYIFCASAILKISDPKGAPENYELWATFDGDDLGLEVRGSSIPTPGQILDVAFDGINPGVLVRFNPDTDLEDGGVLYVFDMEFRQVLWQRTYDEPPVKLSINQTLYPQSVVVHLGKTLAPPAGEGPSGTEVLGGFV